MSTTWQCHYRRNKAGYPNQWEQCASEIQHMMVCSDPIFTAPINVVGSAYYLPLGPGGQLYRNVSGFFLATGTTGTGPAVPVPFATVGVVLNGYDANGIPFPLINQNFTANANGVASGFFPCQGGKTMIGVSGIISYLSGNLTGVILINTFCSDLPVANLSATSNSAANNIEYSVSNPIGITLNIDVERAENTAPTLFTTQTTDNLGASAGGPTHTGVITAFHGYLYRTSYTPLYSTKAVKGDTYSGGAPPALTSMEFYWSGIRGGSIDVLFWEPTIIVHGNHTYSGWYDGLVSLEYKDTGSSGPWNTAGSLALFESGDFVFDVSSLTAAPVYDFRASGCHYDTFSQCFWTNIISGQFNITQIIASASSSITGCGVDVFWQAPNGGPFTVQIALNAGMNVGLSTVGGITNAYYRHNTSASCGQVFYYRIQDANSFLSNVTSGSGIYSPPRPDFSLTQVDDSGILVDWSAMTETSIDYISGLAVETNINSIQPSSGVKFTYTNSSATIHLPLNPLTTGFTPVYLDLYSVFQNRRSATSTQMSIELPAP